MKKMKSFIGLLLVATVMMTLLTGCNSSAKTVDINALATDIYNGVTWVDNISSIDLEKAKTLYGVDSTIVANGVVYVSSNATAEEIAVWEAADKDQVANLQDYVTERISAQMKSFENYNPEEVAKLENAYVATKGNYVIMVVCDDPTQAESVVEDAFK